MKSRIVLCVLAALATTPVMAAEPTGFYLGFDLGQSSFDIDAGDPEDELLDWLGDDSGLSVLEASSETSDSAFSWGLHLGYQVLPYVAVEAGYIDLGSAEYKVRGVVADDFDDYQAEAVGNLDSSGFVVSALGMVPLWDSGWDVFGRVGMYFGSNDLEESLTVDDVTDAAEDDTSSESFVWGVGISYTSGQWTSRLEYQQYLDVGEEGDFDGVDLSRIVFGAVYRTGFGAR